MALSKSLLFLVVLIVVGAAGFYSFRHLAGNRLAADCGAQLALPARGPASVAWESAGEGQGRLVLSLAATDARPLYLLVRTARPSIDSVSAPQVLRSSGEALVLRSALAPASEGFSVGTNSGYAHVPADALATLLDRPQSVRYPVAGRSRITQAAGAHEGPYSHTPESGLSNAVDIQAPMGTPVRAAREGEVVYVESAYPDLGCGDARLALRDNRVIVLHDDGTEATYGHLREASVRVRVGERVSTGQVLAGVGNSGASGVPHLHFQVGVLSDGGYFTLPLEFNGCGAGGFAPALGEVVCPVPDGEQAN